MKHCHALQPLCLCAGQCKFSRKTELTKKHVQEIFIAVTTRPATSPHIIKERCPWVISCSDASLHSKLAPVSVQARDRKMRHRRCFAVCLGNFIWPKLPEHLQNTLGQLSAYYRFKLNLHNAKANPRIGLYEYRNQSLWLAVQHSLWRAGSGKAGTHIRKCRSLPFFHILENTGVCPFSSLTSQCWRSTPQTEGWQPLNSFGAQILQPASWVKSLGENWCREIQAQQWREIISIYWHLMTHTQHSGD